MIVPEILRGLAWSELADLSNPSLWRPRRGGWLADFSASTPSPHSEIAPSIQVEVPDGAALRVQAECASGRFLDVGWAGDPAFLPRRYTTLPGGKVDTDLLRLTTSKDSWRIRLSTDADQKPWSWNWGLCGVTWRPKDADPAAFKKPRLAKKIEIDVPIASQMAEGGEDGRIACSPTCLQMQLAHRGVRATVPRVMKLAHDPIEQLYGNWQKAIGAAWALGRRAAFVYLRNWDQVLACLKDGIPVGASIKFPKGKVDLPGAPIEHSSGHLLVVRGLTPDGWVITNDPAGKTRAEVPRKYPIEAFSRAWFGFSGVGYLVFPRS